MKKTLVFLSVNIVLCLLCSCGNSNNTSSHIDEAVEHANAGAEVLSADEENNTSEKGLSEQSDTENNDAYKITCYKSSDCTTGDSGVDNDVWTIDDEQFCVDFVTWAENIPNNYEEREKPEPNAQTAVGGYSLDVQYRDENEELHNLEQTKDPSANIKLDGEYYHISAGDLDMFNSLYDYQ